MESKPGGEHGVLLKKRRSKKEGVIVNIGERGGEEKKSKGRQGGKVYPRDHNSEGVNL